MNDFERGKKIMRDLTCRNTFDKVINERLEDPNITANDICVLAEAYSNLTKNDWMKDMYNKFDNYNLDNKAYLNPMSERKDD